MFNALSNEFYRFAPTFTNHNSFDFKENSYIPSGFVITAKVNSAYSADNISAYINLSYVQNFLKAMSAGKSQKNIS